MNLRIFSASLVTLLLASPLAMLQAGGEAPADNPDLTRAKPSAPVELRWLQERHARADAVLRALEVGGEDTAASCPGANGRYEVLGKMRPPDNIAFCKGTRARIAAADTRPGQAPANLLGTPVAKFTQTGKPCLQDLTARVDPQTEHVDGLRLPANRYFHTRHQL